MALYADCNTIENFYIDENLKLNETFTIGLKQ